MVRFGVIFLFTSSVHSLVYFYCQKMSKTIGILYPLVPFLRPRRLDRTMTGSRFTSVWRRNGKLLRKNPKKHRDFDGQNMLSTPKENTTLSQQVDIIYSVLYNFIRIYWSFAHTNSLCLPILRTMGSFWHKAAKCSTGPESCSPTLGSWGWYMIYYM